MAEHGLKTRFGRTLGRMKRPEKLATLTLLFLLLTITTASVTNELIGPDWGSLWKGLLVGLLIGWLLAIFGQPAPRSILTILVVGAAYSLLVAGSLGQKVAPVLFEPFRLGLAFVTTPSDVKPDLSPLLGLARELVNAVAVVMSRISEWVVALIAGEPTFDPVAAGIMWSMLVFLVAAWAGWVVEAGRNAILAVAPAILLCVVTLSYVGDTTTTLYIVLGLTLILLATVQHDRRESEWESDQIAYPSRKGRQIGYIAVLLTAGLVLISAFVSSISLHQIEKWLTIKSRTAEQGEGRLATSLGILQSRSSIVDTFDAVRRPGLPRDMLIGSGPELSRELVMSVEVHDLPSSIPASQPWPLYWRSFTYDVYTGAGWRSSNTEESVYEPNRSIDIGKIPNHLLIMETIRPVEDSEETVYSAGEPVKVDQPISAAWRSDGDLFGIQIDTKGVYDVQSLVPAVNEQVLRAAGQRYPDWVRQRYLALPPNLPGRVRELAIELTSTEPTPYDRVRSIERYLRTFPYTLDVTRPPSNQDLVDYFVFSLNEGYCDYYASAMVVLARAAGIPARLAIGYASGEYNLNSQRFIITEADAHSWVEVYFPNTGWIPFEPTASRPLLEELPRVPSDLHVETQLPGTASVPIVGSRTWLWPLLPATFFLLIFMLLAWTFYDQWRLSSLPEAAAAVEVYRRMRRYGKRLDAEPERGDTPYEYATILSRRLEQLSTRGTGSELGPITAREVLALTDRIVHLSYRPIQFDENSPTHIYTQWHQIRWRLASMLLLKHWKDLNKKFSFTRTRDKDAINEDEQVNKSGEEREE